MTEVMGGQIPLTIDTVTASRPLIESGKLKAIAVTSSKPSELLPGVNGCRAGHARLRSACMECALRAEGHSAGDYSVAERRDAENHGAARDSQKLLSLGFERGGGTAEQLAEFGRAERRKWGPIITVRESKQSSSKALDYRA